MNGVRPEGGPIGVELLDRASGQPTTLPSVSVTKRFPVVQEAVQRR